ncbi:MFS transporter [Serratia sp. UGAL515B_01]|uniref:MFS transporter n=1 Tax=Serratia sp. UGAL515B_01 TaxID=2986763 RepID=UPI0029552D2F|nr:MFS transporter [Serratia sp. UGAL515B_01]WON78193.1 MFS transporter [Serratia sp. UGAL515B_01]
MSPYSRPVLLLLCGLLFLTVSIAVLNTLVPLWLTHAQLLTWQVGVVSSSYFSGNLVGTVVAGKLINRIGFTRSYHLACLLFALATIGMGLSLDFWSWIGWRFFAGVGCAWIWVIVESALLRSGNRNNRGQLLAAYMMVYYLGTVAGQLLLGMVSTELLHVLPWVAAIVMAAMLPMLFVRVNHQEDESQKATVWLMLKRRCARLGINGCIISGIILGSLYGLMPLYLAHQGMSDAKIGYWMALLVSSGIAGQWPVGRVADRYGRLLVLRIQVSVLILASIAMMGNYAMASALFILGCAGFTLYPVAMSWACEKVLPHELVAMNQTLLMSYTIGSLLGPSMTSLLMQNYSDRLLFVVIAGVALVYLVMLLRNSDRYHTPLAAA